MYSYCYVYVFLLLCMFYSVYSVFIVFLMYCLCVNVYCTTATGCQPNCSSQIYHIIPYIISYHIKCIIPYHISYHIVSYHIVSYIISYNISKDWLHAPSAAPTEKETTIINGTAKTPGLDVVVTNKKCPCLESIAERPTHSLVNALRYPTEVPIETYKRVYAYRHAYR